MNENTEFKSNELYQGSKEWKEGYNQGSNFIMTAEIVKPNPYEFLSDSFFAWFHGYCEGNLDFITKIEKMRR